MQPAAKTLTTLKCPTRFTLEEKRSRFIACLYPVAAKDEVRPIIDHLKTQYPDARHHCWAYVIGNPEQASQAGFNDDGEPSGTAGKPILNVLMMRKVGNVCAVVVRYFGGIKLGAGGLVRAYGAAVSNALDGAELFTLRPTTSIAFEVPFALEAHVRALLTKAGAANVHCKYHHAVHIHAQLDAEKAADLCKSVIDQTNGKATMIKT